MPCHSSMYFQRWHNSEMEMLLPHVCVGCINVSAVGSTALPVTQIGLLSFGEILALGYKVVWDPKCYRCSITSWADRLNGGGRSSGRGRLSVIGSTFLLISSLNTGCGCRRSVDPCLGEEACWFFLLYVLHLCDQFQVGIKGTTAGARKDYLEK